MTRFGLAPDERVLARLRTPRQVQDFVEAIPINFERGGETCMSPRRVLRENRAHCVEGAMLAALALRVQGRRPWLCDLRATRDDDDHVVALFRERGRWGAVSKTNHAVLRFRDPVYVSVRELAMSYFHEYFIDDGRKVLREYSDPFDLSRFDRRGWMTSERDLCWLPRALDRAPHHALLPRGAARALRRADPIELRAGDLVRWRK